MDTAWGRRVYDQYEIEVAVEAPKNKYLNDGTEGDSRGPKELGLWDIIFNHDIVNKLDGLQKYILI